MPSPVASSGVGAASLARNQHVRTGAANTWSVISADPALGLIYLPTGAASPDYFSGMHPGDDKDGNSIVALEAATGKVRAFQVVHHDIWHYDIASQPLLFTFRGATAPTTNTPVIAVTTKWTWSSSLIAAQAGPFIPSTSVPSPDRCPR